MCLTFSKVLSIPHLSRANFLQFVWLPIRPAPTFRRQQIPNISSASYLFARLDSNVFGEDLPGLGYHLGLRLDVPVFLTCQPELQVLLTELGVQERTEGSHPI